jgi:hypothetical protein
MPRFMSLSSMLRMFRAFRRVSELACRFISPQIPLKPSAKAAARPCQTRQYACKVRQTSVFEVDVFRRYFDVHCMARHGHAKYL